jgi:hypothetical protein
MTPRKAQPGINKTAMRQHVRIAAPLQDLILIGHFLLSFGFTWRLGVLAAI